MQGLPPTQELKSEHMGWAGWDLHPASGRVAGRVHPASCILYVSGRRLQSPYAVPLEACSQRPLLQPVNRLAAARERIGAIPFDLTISNPTACGISYPSDLLAGLADPRGLAYEPDPRGSLATRNVVAAGYEQWGVSPDARRIVLTASTSEAYGFLFRLFCDPGEAVLVPSPSYPLFEYLARLDGIEAPTYALDGDAGWRIDFSTLASKAVLHRCGLLWWSTPTTRPVPTSTPTTAGD